MIQRIRLNRVGFWILAASFGLGPATMPATTQPEEALTEAQQSLLLQLSDAEVNIKALNLALIRTGYKVGLTYDRIDSNAKANELMDRRGGGPVGWQDFYGKTARSFYMPDSAATIHAEGAGRRVDVHVTEGARPIQRPKAFDSIYKANNDQITRAKAQVATLAQDQVTLLARRQKHEADQSRLWAMLAWTRIADREIGDKPLCRFKLTGASGEQDPRAQVLRPVVLFLRTADRVAGDSLESIKTNLDGTFADQGLRMNAAYGALRGSVADAMLATDLNEADKKQVEGLKALCKQLVDESSVVADNYRSALDRDRAKEDDSKLVFRGKLQESLAKFSATVVELEAQVGEAAKAWGISIEKGVSSPDALPTAITKSPSPTSPASPIAPATNPLQARGANEKAVIRVSYSGGGGATVEKLTDGVAYFSNRKYTVSHVPPDLTGFSFVRITGGKPSTATVAVPSGETVFLFLDSDKGANHGDSARQCIRKLNKEEWTRLDDLPIKAGKNTPIAVFRKQFVQADRFTVTSNDFSGVSVAAKALEIGP